MPNPLDKAEKVAGKLNCTTETTTLMIECLRKVSPEELIEAVKVLMVYLDGVPHTVFGPSLEKNTESFLAEHPYKILRDGKVYDVPWIDSNVKSEGIFPVGREYLKKTVEYYFFTRLLSVAIP